MSIVCTEAQSNCNSGQLIQQQSQPSLSHSSSNLNDATPPHGEVPTRNFCLAQFTSQLAARWYVPQQSSIYTSELLRIEKHQNGSVLKVYKVCVSTLTQILKYPKMVPVSQSDPFCPQLSFEQKPWFLEPLHTFHAPGVLKYAWAKFSSGYSNLQCLTEGNLVNL